VTLVVVLARHSFNGRIVCTYYHISIVVLEIIQTFIDLRINRDIISNKGNTKLILVHNLQIARPIRKAIDEI
jgi:hypothetical protein